MGETLGTVRLPLVGGTTLPESTEETFGLVSLTGLTGGTWGGPSEFKTCSGCLLRPDWVVVAAHCVEAVDANDDPIPDPSVFGRFQLLPSASVRVNARWGGGQQSTAVRIVSFRPSDVALIQINPPIAAASLPPGSTRLINEESLFPYFGTEVSMDLTLFGRGINQFASGAYGLARPASGDGRFRVGYAKVARSSKSAPALLSGLPHDDQIWFKNDAGQFIAGGDSGGPSFTWTSRGYALVGVHSLATLERVLGKEDTEGWEWVSATPEAADAPLRALRAELLDVMGTAAPPSGPPSTPVVPAFGEVTTPDPAISAFVSRRVAAAERGAAVGIPTFFDSREGTTEYGETIFVAPEAVEWRNVPLGQLDSSAVDDFNTHMRAINQYASEHGFPGAIPSFEVRDFGDGPRVGVFLVKPTAAEWRDVTLKELGLMHLDLDDVSKRFKATQTYASQQGFVGGYPNMFHADHEIIEPVSKKKVILSTRCGTVLLRPGYAERAKVPLFRGPA